MVRPTSDLELEHEDDDATTELVGLPWPEPPRSLSDRARAIRTDGIGLSRSVRAPEGSGRAFMRLALVLAALAALGFVSVSFYVFRRALLREKPSAAAASPQPTSAAPLAAPSPALSRPHLSIIVGTPPPKKPAIDINNLPPAPQDVTKRGGPPLNLKRPPVKPAPRPTGPSSESAPPEVRPPMADTSDNPYGDWAGDRSPTSQVVLRTSD